MIVQSSTRRLTCTRCRAINVLYTLTCTRQDFDVSNSEEIKISFAMLRSRTGLTQEELARALADTFKRIGSDRKVTKKSVSDWETGRHKPRFTPEETLEVCNLLGCSLSELAEASMRIREHATNSG